MGPSDARRQTIAGNLGHHTQFRIVTSTVPRELTPARRSLSRRGPARCEKEKRRFRVRECWDLPTHREPLSRTRRSVCIRSHVPGIRRDRAQADEVGIKKTELQMRFLPQESADGPSSQGIRPMNRLWRTSEVDATWLGDWTGGGYVRGVYAPEPSLRAIRGLGVEVSGEYRRGRGMEALWEARQRARGTGQRRLRRSGRG